MEEEERNHLQINDATSTFCSGKFAVSVACNVQKRHAAAFVTCCKVDFQSCHCKPAPLFAATKVELMLQSVKGHFALTKLLSLIHI